MKKNIGFVNMDSSLMKWMVDRLKMAPAEYGGREEIISAFEEMLYGDTNSLMVEIAENGMPVTSGGELHAGELSIFTKSRRVLRNGVEISLTPKEFDILYFLACNKGEVFTKEQIYQAVWKEEMLLDDSNIMAFIRKLRKKIEPNPDEPKFILTLWGIGYKFNDKL